MRQPKGENWNQCESNDCHDWAPFDSIKGRPRRYCRKCEEEKKQSFEGQNLMPDEINDRLLA